MSLYNMLFNVNENAPILLGMLGVNMGYFERFRDVHLMDNGTKIRVLTRTGGGNREPYKDNWQKIRSHPNYLKDYSDDFDSTYAYIIFSIPEKYLRTSKNMFESEPKNIQELFEAEIDALGDENSDASKRAQILIDKLIDGTKNGNNFIEI